jgi:hypothetical protein
LYASVQGVFDGNPSRYDARHPRLCATGWQFVLADGTALVIIRLVFNPGEHVMSKGLDKKKETKKKPEKTLKEKRAEKHAKKGK